jgi:hypothetical protein
MGGGGGGVGGAFLSTAFMGIFFPALIRASRSMRSFSAVMSGFTFRKEGWSIMLAEDFTSTPASLRSFTSRSLEIS